MLRYLCITQYSRLIRINDYSRGDDNKIIFICPQILLFVYDNKTKNNHIFKPLFQINVLTVKAKFYFN